ncbi:unnamed protein product [Miscanthus lutarioriparius]|uniref:Uncharacterized protein n=1 Tax=Miscanthus lutarioriparius TaxID=422564 RepID=A0A811P649_9POAL|nr:unnamed protein product [Miscanthus lutarioriparius]
MPAGGSSYLATMGRRSFSYHRLKKLPAAAPSPPHPPATTAPTTGLELGDPPCAAASAAAIEESYRSYYRALVARGTRQRRRQQPWRGGGRPRRRLRAWGALARALRRRAAAAGARVRASVARVARRLRDGRPYVGDVFAGNYMFLQVSPTMAGGGADGRARGAVVPFAEYYYGCKARARAGAGGVQLHPAAAAGVLYKV